jgi:hypothetical protein
MLPFAIPLLDPAIKLINSVVDKVVPDVAKRDELKAQLAEQVEKGNFDIELASINAVNATMQAEAKSEHWAQWLWRPVIGFTFAAVILNNYILLPYTKLQPIVIPAEVWTAMLVILGASAATRGWEKVAKAQKG